MNKGKATLIGLALLAALGLGKTWATRHRPPSAAALRFTALRDATLPKLEAENRRLRDAVARRESGGSVVTINLAGHTLGPAEARALTPVQRLQVLADLKEKKWAVHAGTFLELDGKITPLFADMFSLTPAEHARMSAATDRAREKIAILEHAHGTITREPNGEIKLSVRPFPTEGGKVFDETMQEIATILGSARYDAFRRLSLEWFEKSFGGFGVAERTYVFRFDKSAEKGPYTLSQRIEGRGSTKWASSSTRRFKTYAELANYAGPIVDYLPPDYPRSR